MSRSRKMQRIPFSTCPSCSAFSSSAVISSAGRELRLVVPAEPVELVAANFFAAAAAARREGARVGPCSAKTGDSERHCLCSPVSLSLLLLAAAALRVMRRPEPSLCVACVWGSSTADSSSVFRVRRDTLSGERSTILGLVTLCAWASARESETRTRRDTSSKSTKGRDKQACQSQRWETHLISRPPPSRCERRIRNLPCNAAAVAVCLVEASPAGGVCTVKILLVAGEGQGLTARGRGRRFHVPKDGLVWRLRVPCKGQPANQPRHDVAVRAPRANGLDLNNS